MVSRRRLKDAHMLLNLNKSVARNALRALILTYTVGVQVTAKSELWKPVIACDINFGIL